MSKPIHIPDAVRIQPPRRNPFYIVAPSYTHQSAGIKALHLFCHCLNRRGQMAYMVNQNIYDVVPFEPMDLNPDLLTPLLTLEIYKRHRDAGLTPIVVYPETITGNPLKASVVARYVLNFPGLLGGDKVYPPEELVFAYSKKLADAAGVGEDRVLFLPASDTNIFHRRDDEQPRAGTCFYADKYKKVHDGQLFEITKGAVEITRGIGSQTTEEVAELFRRSELFYCYENSALAIEAMLCGCPTVFLPNEHLTEIIASQELGMDGFAWGAAPEEIERARNTVDQAFENYIGTYVRFWQQLERFIAVTTERAATINAAVPPLWADSDAAEPGTAAAGKLDSAARAAEQVQLERSLWDKLWFDFKRSSLFRRKHRWLVLIGYVGLLGLAYWYGTQQ